VVETGTMTGDVPAPGDASHLHEWLARQYPVSVAAMLGTISATHLIKERRGFGQTIRPLPGSVLASTSLGSWDPDPDYFFHWLRDSAIVIDALRHVIVEGRAAGEGSLVSRSLSRSASPSIGSMVACFYASPVISEKYGSVVPAIRA